MAPCRPRWVTCQSAVPAAAADRATAGVRAPLAGAWDTTGAARTGTGPSDQKDTTAAPNTEITTIRPRPRCTPRTAPIVPSLDTDTSPVGWCGLGAVQPVIGHISTWVPDRTMRIRFAPPSGLSALSDKPGYSLSCHQNRGRAVMMMWNNRAGGRGLTTIRRLPVVFLSLIHISEPTRLG